MPLTYYRDALKLAQKESHACAAKGLSPYLPSLEELIPLEQLSKSVDLGLCQVPMEFVVGTRDISRTRAFARNFMPLMEEDSEFATKWMRLCQSHTEEGIREAVKLYEYKNRYYVQEGNKRVSVLKFFEADQVYAQVNRVLPERDGSEETELYFELIDFMSYSHVNFIEFSKPGSCARLQRLLGKEPKEPWTEEERRGFATAYYYFRQAYIANGGKKLSSTVGDAMLAYILVYGYQDLRQKGPGEIRKSVARVWEEITLQQEKPAIDVKLDPAKEKSALSIAKVLPIPEPKPLKAAFLFDKTPDQSGWTYAHELGRRHVQRVFDGELETTPYYNAFDGDPQEAIDRAIAEGNTVLFTTSPRLLPASLRAAVENPKVTILNCSLNKSHRLVRTYYARMYEVKFITGAIAGTLCGSNDVGYICDYPIYGQVAGINAFALGVQMVNPRVKVYLEWSGTDGVQEAAKKLVAQGVRLISSQDQVRLGDAKNSSFGLSLVGEDGKVSHLAMSLYRWGVYYETIIRRIRSKSFQAEDQSSGKALNYYWGMSSGVVDLRCSEKLPDSTRKLAALLRDGICVGSCDPFRGPFYAQGGRQVAADGQTLRIEQIIDMDWLAENVRGSIPKYGELNESGKAIVGIVGIDPSKKESLS